MTTQEYLNKHNIKPSLQRIAIMDYLFSHKTHPTVDEIYLSLHPSIPTLSKTTVYNTLKLFADQGAALSLSIDEKNARFDGDITPHAHFQCMKCGRIYDLPISSNAEVNNLYDLEINDMQVYLKGYCEKCKNREN